MFNINYKYFKLLGIYFSMALCSWGIVKLQNQQLSQNLSTQDDINYLKQEKYLQSLVQLQKKLPAFGLDNLFADWSYLRFIQYFGDTEARKVTGYSVVTDYFENIVNRDPNFVNAHLYMSSANSLFAGRPKKTVSLIDKALETVTPQNPYNPFFLWTYKATDEILFLGNLEAAQNSYEKAAQWADARNNELGEELAERYRKTAKFLATNPDSTDTQIAAWVNVLNQAPDAKTQQHAINELKILGVDISVTESGKIQVTRQERV